MIGVSNREFLYRALPLVLAVVLFPVVLACQSTDLKVAINNQIRYQEALQEQDRGSLANAAIESYRSIQEAKAYLKAHGIPDFAAGEKNLEALSTAYYGGRLAERHAREAYIDRLRIQLRGLEQQNTIGAQPLSSGDQTTLHALVKALAVQSDLERQYAQKQTSSVELVKRLQYQYEVQVRTEQTQREIQQRAQPLAPQQVATINTMVQQIQQQQQQNRQQNQHLIQMQQQQQQTQPLNQQQQQMITQLVQALRSQVQQNQASQQQLQRQQQQLQQLY